MMPFMLLLAMSLQSAGDFQRQGEEAFRAGRFAESVAAFDKVIALMPREAPQHWQRGISLYYAGRFKDCEKQFELHRTVNPEDFENAAWHMLCGARINGFAEAQKRLIPIREDSRVPMRELHLLWKGQGTVDAVLAAAGRDRSALFYANLYLALFEEARGQRAKSRSFAAAANELAPGNYMGDVARIHWRQLSANTLP